MIKDNVILKCKQCGKVLKVREHGKGRQRTSFCCDRCRELFFNDRKLKFDDYMPVSIAKVKMVNCAFCGELFPQTHQARKYCSLECKYDAIDKKMDEHNEKLKFQCRGPYLGTSMTHFRGSTYVFSSDDDKKKPVATFTPDDGVYNVNISDLPDDF
jgi:endogenous inhibitor of DNA gyrase (YacG/DUF329 family)